MQFVRYVIKMAAIVVAIASVGTFLIAAGEVAFSTSRYFLPVFVPMVIFCLIAGSLVYFEIIRKRGRPDETPTSPAADGNRNWSEYKIRAWISATVTIGGWILFQLMERNQFRDLPPYFQIFMGVLLIGVTIVVLLLSDYEYSVPCPRCGKPFFGRAVKVKFRFHCPNCGLRRLENP